MSSLLARTGRDKQRYEDQLRLVAGSGNVKDLVKNLNILAALKHKCIPYRLERNLEGCHGSSENKLLVLMISSPNRDDLVFPKGGWENDETIYEAACREALEEAGVKGVLSETPLGDWKFRSKSRQKSCSVEGGCRGYMFALKVTEELDSWPEQTNHKRKWLTTDEAFKFCRYDWMRDALERLLTVLSAERAIRRTEEPREVMVKPIPDAVEERQMSSPCCFDKPSSVQHLDNYCSKCIV